MRRHHILGLLSVVVLSAACAAQDLSADEIFSRHLQSIGTAEARQAAKSRTGEGAAWMRVIVGGLSNLDGQAAMFSAGNSYKFVLRFPSATYPGEQIVFDGKKATIALTGPNLRSVLGDFLYREPTMLREGLFGGSIFTSWALLDLASRQGKLKYDGTRKFAGRELLQLTYIPKKSGDALIHLFFEPETFRHVRSLYSLEVEPSMARSQTVRGDKVRYTLEERFSDFNTVEGLTLPSNWDVRMTVEPVRASTLEWQVRFMGFTNNPPVDPKSVIK